MCGRDADNETLLNWVQNWRKENGEPTYDSLLEWADNLGYELEIAEIGFQMYYEQKRQEQKEREERGFE